MMAKPTPLKWIGEGIARKTIADALGYGTPTASQAYNALYEVLRDGDVHAQLREQLDNGSLSKKGRPLKPSFWTAEEGGKQRAPWDKDPDGIVEIDRPSLMKWLSAKRDGRRRGAEPRWDWVPMLRAFMARFINEPESFPDRQAGLERMIRDWFMENYSEEPSESVIREQASELFRQVKAGKADN